MYEQCDEIKIAIEVIVHTLTKIYKLYLNNFGLFI